MLNIKIVKGGCRGREAVTFGVVGILLVDFLGKNPLFQIFDLCRDLT